jgi:hypothetical protein
VLQNFHEIDDIKCSFVNRYNVSPIIMGRTPPEGLVMVKRWAAPRMRAIWGGM